jgi:hypothetical protein
MFRRITKKRVALVVAPLAALALAAGAYAYFSTSGTGTSQASVGHATNFSVSFGAASGTMYPGTGSTAIPYTITNPSGSGVQNLSATQVAVAKDSSGNITDHGTSVAGCLQSWFTATDAPPVYGEIADGATKSGTVTVTMSDANTSQDSCKSHSPDVVVSAS